MHNEQLILFFLSFIYSCPAAKITLIGGWDLLWNMTNSFSVAKPSLIKSLKENILSKDWISRMLQWLVQTTVNLLFFLLLRQTRLLLCHVHGGSDTYSVKGVLFSLTHLWWLHICFNSFSALIKKVKWFTITWLIKDLGQVLS